MKKPNSNLEKFLTKTKSDNSKDTERWIEARYPCEAKAKYSASTGTPVAEVVVLLAWHADRRYS